MKRWRIKGVHWKERECIGKRERGGGDSREKEIDSESVCLRERGRERGRERARARERERERERERYEETTYRYFTVYKSYQVKYRLTKF